MTDSLNALDQAQESLERTEALLGPDHPYVADRLEDYARLLRAEGNRLLDAVNLEARANAIRKKHGVFRSESQIIQRTALPEDQPEHKLTASSLFHALIDDARKWCDGRQWLPRLLLLLWMIPIFIEHLRNPIYQSIFKGLNLGIHEVGHMIFMPFGEFIAVAGGSFFQCLVPFIAMGMFLFQRDYFGIAFAWGWLSTNLFDVATYIGDARAMELPLVSPFGGGGESIHDWNYLLTAMHLLKQDTAIAMLVRASAVISMLVFFAFGGWLLWQMYKRKPNPFSGNF